MSEYQISSKASFMILSLISIVFIGCVLVTSWLIK